MQSVLAEPTEYTATPATLALIYRLVATAQSAKFTQSLKVAWPKAATNPNIEAIWEKAASRTLRTIEFAARYRDFEGMVAFLDHTAKTMGVKVRKSDRRALVWHLDLAQFNTLSEFIAAAAKANKNYGEILAGQHACFSVLNDMMEYFLIKDGIENGTGMQRLDGIISTLIDTKPVTFFQGGYLSDLFVVDRCSLALAKGGFTMLVKPDRLSTRLVPKGEALGDIGDAEVFAA